MANQQDIEDTYDYMDELFRFTRFFAGKKGLERIYVGSHRKILSQFLASLHRRTNSACGTPDFRNVLIWVSLPMMPPPCYVTIS